jgi:hypothetical protein
MHSSSKSPECIPSIATVPIASGLSPHPPTSPTVDSSFRLDPNSPLALPATGSPSSSHTTVLPSTSSSSSSRPEVISPEQQAAFEACFLSKTSPLVVGLCEKVPGFTSLVREVRCQSCLDLDVDCTIKSNAQTCDHCHKKRTSCELPSLLRYLAFASDCSVSLENTVHLALLVKSHKSFVPLSPLLRQRVVSYQLARTDALEAALSLEHKLGVLEQTNERVEVQRFMDIQVQERRRAQAQRGLSIHGSRSPPSPSSTPSRKRKRRQVEDSEVPPVEAPRPSLRFKLPPLPRSSPEVILVGEGVDHPSKREEKRRRREKRARRKLLESQYSMPDPEAILSGNNFTSVPGSSSLIPPSSQAPAVVPPSHTVFVGDCPDVKELTNVRETLFEAYCSRR